MSNGRILLIVSAVIVAGLGSLLWQRIQECFFTEGQTCQCSGGFRSAGCVIVKRQ
jgi:hypothetical protein